MLKTLVTLGEIRSSAQFILSLRCKEISKHGERWEVSSPKPMASNAFSFAILGQAK